MDIYQDFRIFTDVWRFYKKYHMASMNEEYWQAVVKESGQISEHYKSGLCDSLLSAVIEVLDKRARMAERRKPHVGI